MRIVRFATLEDAFVFVDELIESPIGRKLLGPRIRKAVTSRRPKLRARARQYLVKIRRSPSRLWPFFTWLSDDQAKWARRAGYTVRPLPEAWLTEPDELESDPFPVVTRERVPRMLKTRSLVTVASDAPLENPPIDPGFLTLLVLALVCVTSLTLIHTWAQVVGTLTLLGISVWRRAYIKRIDKGAEAARRRIGTFPA